MRTLSFLVLTVFVGLSQFGYGQGCSDAGFCSAGAMHGDYAGEAKWKNFVKLGVSYERGEQSTSIFSPQIEGRFLLDEDNMIQIKIPYLIASGNLGTNHGLSDFIVSYTRTVLNDDRNWRLQVTGGMRLAAGNANDELDGNSLPMPYQPSLGTYDLILGTAVTYKKTWLLAAGLQWPLIQNNNNAYNPLDWPDESGYYLSRELQRQPDVMLRLEKSFRWEKWSIRGGILPIYHLGDDTFETQPLADESPREVTSEGSQGLTLNLVGGIGYTIKDRWNVDLTIAAPAIVRETRPDGLTRSLVVLPSVQYAF